MNIGDLWDFGITDDPFPMDIPDPLAQQPATSEESSWWNSVQKFKEKADEFWSAYKRLEALEPVAMQTPDTARSYNNVMSGGDTITSNIEGVADTIKAAAGWAGGFFGVENIRQAQLGSLGLLPVAIIVAAISAMGIWLTDAYVEISKLEAIKELTAGGTPVGQAAELVRAGGGGGFATALGSELGKGIAFAALAGVGIWFLMRKG